MRKSKLDDYELRPLDHSKVQDEAIINLIQSIVLLAARDYEKKGYKCKAQDYWSAVDFFEHGGCEDLIGISGDYIIKKIKEYGVHGKNNRCTDANKMRQRQGADPLGEDM